MANCELETLLCSHNQLCSFESIAQLQEIQTLQTVDLQNNLIEDPRVLTIFQCLPALKCLYLKGNPVVSKIPNYR